MIKSCFSVFFALHVLAVSATAEEPPELTKLRGAYRAAVDRVAEPLSRTYLAELEKLRDSLVAKSKLPAANAVQQEIDLIKGPSAAATATSGAAGKLIVLETTATIPASTPTGYKLGSVQKGDVITLTYVSGKWKSHGILATENPDAEEIETGDASRLAIASGRYKTRAGPLITLVPPGTAKKPFIYRFLAPEENVVLRINEGSESETSPGSVIYNVRISR